MQKKKTAIFQFFLEFSGLRTINTSERWEIQFPVLENAFLPWPGHLLFSPSLPFFSLQTFGTLIPFDVCSRFFGSIFDTNSSPGLAFARGLGPVRADAGDSLWRLPSVSLDLTGLNAPWRLTLFWCRLIYLQTASWFRTLSPGLTENTFPRAVRTNWACPNHGRGEPRSGIVDYSKAPLE